MTIAIKPMAISTLGTIEIICGELIEQALEQTQAWSDQQFDDQYREAMLTLIEGMALLVGYVAGYLYSWLSLQGVRTVLCWLAEATQAVPVTEGWWSAPFVVVAPVRYPEYYWQRLDAARSAEIGILDYELSYAEDAEEVLAVLR